MLEWWSSDFLVQFCLPHSFKRAHSIALVPNIDRNLFLTKLNVRLVMLVCEEKYFMCVLFLLLVIRCNSFNSFFFLAEYKTSPTYVKWGSFQIQGHCKCTILVKFIDFTSRSRNYYFVAHVSKYFSENFDKITNKQKKTCERDLKAPQSSNDLITQRPE